MHSLLDRFILGFPTLFSNNIPASESRWWRIDGVRDNDPDPARAKLGARLGPLLL